MSVTITRRDFLKAGAAAGAGLTFLRFVGFRRGAAEASSLLQSTAGEVEWRPNVCNICPNFCGIQVAVKKVGDRERAVKIEGDPQHPYNQGHLCARGQSGLRLLYSPDRIKQPLIRVEGSKRGEWNFRAATWEEAYGYIMQKMQEHQIQPYEMAVMGGWLVCALYSPYLLPFILASQIPNLISSTVQRCMYGQVLGIDSVTGTFNAHAEIGPDYENARFGINFRSNSSVNASTGRIVSYTRGLLEHATSVTLDPRFSEVASHAAAWLPVKPGTDEAFLLATMHQIIADESYDADFLETYTNAPFLAYEEDGALKLAMDVDEQTGAPQAFYVWNQSDGGEIAAVPGVSNRNDQSVDGALLCPALEAETEWNGKKVRTVFSYLKERVADYTPEWAAAICDVDAEKVARAAEKFSRTRPAIVNSGWHDARYDTSPMTWKVAAMIQALVGGIDRPGGWLYNGGQRETIAAFWDALWNGEQPPDLPGIKKSMFMIDLTSNPEKWAHGYPSIAAVWNEQRKAEGQPAVPFPLFADLGLPEAVAGDLTYDGQPYQIKGMMMAALNPVRSFYSAETWEKILGDENLKLVVDVDVLPSDTAAYADVILPDLTYLEKPGVLMDAESPDLAFATRSPVAPVVDGKHVLDIFFDMAQGMGIYEKYVQIMAGMMQADPDAMLQTINDYRQNGKSVAEALRDVAVAKHSAGLGMSAEEMSQSLSKGALLAHSREELMEEAGIPFKYPAPTPSGRIELYSLLFADFQLRSGQYQPGLDPLVAYVPTVFREGMEPGDALSDDEFYIIYGKVATMTHTSTADNDLLMALSKQKEDVYFHIWMNPQRAKALGLSNGDRIVLQNTSSDQQVEAPVFLTEWIRPDTLFFPSNFGQENEQMKTAAGVGAAWNKLIPHMIENSAGGAMASQFIVRVRKA